MNSSVLCFTSFLQSFEKQGFHAGTPAASFSLPSALGSGGPINPPAAAGYAPAPFMHILAPHQQPHSQILHHHLQQDGQVSARVVSHTCSAVQFISTKKKKNILSCLLVLVCFVFFQFHYKLFKRRNHETIRTDRQLICLAV